ncbi:hypothetical protein F3Y22_tig00110818pilonHSYRG00015 [Hibiscus syriacus]|uniref:AT-hook motif nuclear-localized protein n=1 Tax=Hibiscus syriacus TaxID=106335 RepID=A0A6A2ZN50_HIBSY|nr:hypothetical protein F3Y22_tig00110818pilonHSYRG00015 [Hibiscus syriacus]
MDALGGVGGVGFTPHVITVEAGEDVASKIRLFHSKDRAQSVFSPQMVPSLSPLRQPEMSGGTVTYEHLNLDKLDRIHVSKAAGEWWFKRLLAGSDGRVLGGGVVGMLRAASPVQVKTKISMYFILGFVTSFFLLSGHCWQLIADGKKQSSDAFRTGPSSVLASSMLISELQDDKRPSITRWLNAAARDHASEAQVTVVVGKQKREFLVDRFVLEKSPFRVLIETMKKGCGGVMDGRREKKKKKKPNGFSNQSKYWCTKTQDCIVLIVT